jgi:hypothetical protein
MNPPSDRTPTVPTVVTRPGVAPLPSLRPTSPGRLRAAAARGDVVRPLSSRPLPDTPAPAGTCSTERTHR